MIRAVSASVTVPMRFEPPAAMTRQVSLPGAFVNPSVASFFARGEVAARSSGLSRSVRVMVPIGGPTCVERRSIWYQLNVQLYLPVIYDQWICREFLVRRINAKTRYRRRPNGRARVFGVGSFRGFHFSCVGGSGWHR